MYSQIHICSAQRMFLPRGKCVFLPGGHGTASVQPYRRHRQVS